MIPLRFATNEQSVKVFCHQTNFELCVLAPNQLYVYRFMEKILGVNEILFGLTTIDRKLKGCMLWPESIIIKWVISQCPVANIRV